MKRSHKTKDANTTTRCSYVQEKPYNVQEAIGRIPLIKNQPINQLPMYTTVLNKKVTGLEVLDQLQVDLERLLSTCAVRIRYLLNEIKVLDGVEGNKHDAKEHKSVFSERQSTKRKNKSKLNSKPKRQHIVDEQPKVTLLRNEHTDKFWSSIEPYCSPITKNDISFLETLIDEFSNTVEMKIPEVGAHYANEWSDECLNDEQNLARSPKSKTGNNIDVKKNGISSIIDPFSFASTLISSTVDEKVLEFNVNNLKVSDKLKPDEILSSTLEKSSICMERRSKKDFIDLRKGYIHDEILEEIKKYRDELENLQVKHSEKLEKLKEVAIKNLEKNEIHEQLSAVDVNILEVYQKLRSLKKDAQKEQDELSVRHQLNRIDERLLDTRLDFDYEVSESEVMEQYKIEMKALEEQARKLCEKQRTLQRQYESLPEEILL